MPASTAGLPKPINSKNSSYEKYKASLHALFDGKIGLPGHLRQKLDPDQTEPTETHPASEAKASRAVLRRTVKTPDGYDAIIGKLREASTPEEITSAINTVLTNKWVLPKDEEILSKALGAGNSAIVEHALDLLDEILVQKMPKNARLLKSRLEEAALMADSSATRERCLKLVTTIRAQAF